MSKYRLDCKIFKGVWDYYMTRKTILILFYMCLLFSISVASAADIRISKSGTTTTAVYTSNNAVIYSGTSDASAISAALASGNTLHFTNGTYKISSTISKSSLSDVTLIGDGNAILTSTMTSADMFAFGDGVYGSSTPTLSSNVAAGGTQITVSSASGLSAGDYIKISDDYGIYGDGPFFNTVYPLQSTSGYYRGGEIAKINSINGNTITLSHSLYDGYTTARNGFIRKLSMNKNITIDNLKFTGAGMDTESTGFCIYATQNFTMKSCTMNDFGEYAIHLIDVVDGFFTSNIFKRNYLDGTGYSIELGNACDQIQVKQNSFTEKGRHYLSAGSCTGGDDHRGFVRHVIFDHNRFDSATTEAINAHPSTKGFYKVTNNIFINCGKGVQPHNANLYMYKNTITNSAGGNGMELYELGDWVVRDNTINVGAYGIYVQDGAGGTHNIFNNTINAGSHGISLETSSLSSVADKYVIQNNTFPSAGIQYPRYTGVIVNSGLTYQLPVSDFTYTYSNGAYQFTDKSIGSPSSYLWNFGDGTTNTSPNPTHKYASPGYYVVTLTVSNPYGANSNFDVVKGTDSSTPSVNLPTANFGTNVTSGKAPLAVKFTDSSTNTTSWRWDFGDGGTSTGQNPVHIYSSAGTYIVTLTASNTNGTSSKSATITVSANLNIPVANFSMNVSSGNVPLTVQFTDSSKGVVSSRLWNFGDGNTSTSQNPIHTYSNTGTYNVNLTVSNANGSSSKLGMVYAVSSYYAYIANSGSNTVSVINTVANKVIANVSVGARPFGTAVSTDGSRVYVTNNNGRAVTVINTATNTAVATVIVGYGPYGIAINRAGTKVYVANGGDNTVSVIDTATNNVIATLSVGSYPAGIAITPDGTKVYVTNYESNSVSVIDATTNAVASTITVGRQPWGITANQAGTKVYVANYGGSSISIINTTTNAVTSTIPTGSGPYGITTNPEGTKLYVTNSGSNSVSVINTATNSVLASVGVGTTPYGVSVTPDGTKVYVTNSGSNTVSVIDAATNTVLPTPITVGTLPVSLGQFIIPRV